MFFSRSPSPAKKATANAAAHQPVPSSAPQNEASRNNNEDDTNDTVDVSHTPADRSATVTELMSEAAGGVPSAGHHQGHHHQAGGAIGPTLSNMSRIPMFESIGDSTTGAGSVNICGAAGGGGGGGNNNNSAIHYAPSSHYSYTHNYRHSAVCSIAGNGSSCGGSPSSTTTMLHPAATPGLVASIPAPATNTNAQQRPHGNNPSPPASAHNSRQHRGGISPLSPSPSSKSPHNGGGGPAQPPVVSTTLRSTTLLCLVIAGCIGASLLGYVVLVSFSDEADYHVDGDPSPNALSKVGVASANDRIGGGSGGGSSGHNANGGGSAATPPYKIFDHFKAFRKFVGGTSATPAIVVAPFGSSVAGSGDASNNSTAATHRLPAGAATTIYSDAETHLLIAANPHNYEVLKGFGMNDTDAAQYVGAAPRKKDALQEGAAIPPYAAHLNPIDVKFYFGLNGVITKRRRLEEEASKAKQESAGKSAKKSEGVGTEATASGIKTPFAIPPSLLYNDPFLDDPKAAWNQPECFYLRVRAETTYTMDTSYDGSDDGPPEGILDNDHYDFYPWYAEAHDWLTTRGPPPEVGLRCAVPMSILHELYVEHGHGNILKIVDPTNSGPCLLSFALGNNCNPYRESLASCVVRQGYDRLASVVVPRCGLNGASYWKVRLPSIVLEAEREARLTAFTDSSMGRKLSGEEDEFQSSASDQQLLTRPGERITKSRLIVYSTANRAPATPLSMQHTDRARVCSRAPTPSDESASSTTAADVGSNTTRNIPLLPLGMSRYVPPHERDIAPFGTPRNCSANGAKHYPIAFGLTRKNFMPRFGPKIWDFHPVPLVTGSASKALWLDDEELYDTMGALSYFSYTHARGGWECYRHHQQLATGCVPYYIDLVAKPKFVQPNFPLDLMHEVLKNDALAHLGYTAGVKQHVPGGERFWGFRVKPRVSPATGQLLTPAEQGLRQSFSLRSDSSSSAISKPSPPRLYSANDKVPLFVPASVQQFRDEMIAAEVAARLNNTMEETDMRALPRETAYFNMTETTSYRYRTRLDFKQPMGSINHAVFDKDWYWSVARRMKRYSYANMSAESVASYVLKTMGAENAKNVLLIHYGWNDFTELTLELGLDGIGVNTTTVNDDSYKSRECTAIDEGHFAAKKGMLSATIQSIETARIKRTNNVELHGLYYSSLFRRGRYRSSYIPNVEAAMDKIRNYKQQHKNDPNAPPLYDAVIYTYFLSASPMPPIRHAEIEFFLEAARGKVAVINSADSWWDRETATALAEKVFFFSRELRYDDCVKRAAEFPEVYRG